MPMTIWRYLGSGRCNKIPDPILSTGKERTVWMSKDKLIGRERIPLVMLTLLFKAKLSTILIRGTPSMRLFSRKYRNHQLRAHLMLK
jgi:hypothetical protein